MLFEVSQEFKESWGGEPAFDEIMALNGDIYRQVARRKTFKFSLNNKDYFAKIHKGVGWTEVLKNLIQLRWPVLGAINEVRAIKKLDKIGVKTMRIAAYGQRGINPAELESFIITESLEPAESLEEMSDNWMQKPPTVKLKRKLIKKVAQITRTLHENGLNHRDLYICHFLWQEKGEQAVSGSEEIELFLIDLHRVQIRATVPFRWLAKDLAGLLFSSMEIGLTKRDLLRFIRCYSKYDVRSSLTSEADLWRKVEKKANYLKSRPIKT